jgi:hypothetical protein
MILDSIKLKTDKKTFLISKIDGKSYNDIGNFGKYLLKKYNLTINDYIFKYYYDELPKCLESGNVCCNKKVGYWNEFIPLESNFVELAMKVRMKETVISRIYENDFPLFTKYITFEYWIYECGMKLSEALDRIDYFTSQKYGLLYKRLSDNFYDDSWIDENKKRYINTILNMSAEPLYSIYTKSGKKQRGNVSQTEYDNFYKSRYTIFRNSKQQSLNSKKRYSKYSKDDIRKQSVWCVEYWMNRGYSIDESVYRVSQIQKMNTVDSIMNRYECSYNEAVEIQKTIYSKRRDTMNSKPLEELQNIYKSQDSSSLEYCLRKCNYDMESAKKLYAQLKEKKVVPFTKASKESLKYFIPLYKILRKNGFDKSDLYIGINGSTEYRLYSGVNFFMYDFTILSKKIIFEYHGSGHYGFLKEHNIQDIKNRDELKKKLAKSMGFSYIEFDYRDGVDYNKNKINKILNEKLQIKNTNW